MKIKTMVLCLALVSGGAYAQHDHASHKDDKKTDQSQVMFKDENVGQAYAHYAHLKDALVASKAKEAKTAAQELQKALGAVSNGKKAADEASKIAGTSNLEEQRKAFAALSNEMVPVVNGKVSEGAIYQEYCPMAYGGSSWLSNEKEIKNPYFGDKMLKCGTVKQTIQ